MGAKAGGHEVRRIELASRLPPATDPAAWDKEPPPPAIAQAQTMLAWADHIAIFYPLWLSDVPALLKGFLEQALRPGFALEEGVAGPEPGMLRGKSARLVVTMGMPALFFRFYLSVDSVKSFERNILKLIGVPPVRHTLVGGVEGSADDRARALDDLFELGRAGI